MNMVKVFIKGQEDKELSSFLRYYPTRIKNVGIDGVFDRQTIFDFKDGCNQPQVCLLFRSPSPRDKRQCRLRCSA